METGERSFEIQQDPTQPSQYGKEETGNEIVKRNAEDIQSAVNRTLHRGGAKVRV